MTQPLDPMAEIKAEMRANHAEIKSWLMGDPADPNRPGLRLEFDRIKNTVALQTWAIRAIAVAALGAIANAFMPHK